MMKTVDIDLLLKPINESSPAGEDAKYEFCYELMEFEIKKFGSLFGETVDWKAVETNGTEVLTSHSKDLKAICYLTRAWIEREGFNGFETGLSLFSQSLTLFSDSLYPHRKRARDGAVEWFISQLESVLPKLDSQQLSWDQASSCLTLITEIDEKYQESFSDSDVAFFAVRSAVNAIMDRLPQAGMNETASVTHQENEQVDLAQESIEATASVVTAQTIAPVQRKAEPVRQEVDIDTDFSSPSASKKTLKKIAEFMLHSNIGASLAYRLHRYSTWCDVDELPPHDNDKKTPISLAVSQDQLSEYKEKAKHETDPEVIKRLEKTLTDAPFWLSGHHLMYQMLMNLNHESAAEAVKQETALFIQELNGVEALTFANSVPFADEATLKWLASRTAITPAALMPMPLEFSDDTTLSEGEITLATLGDYVSTISQGLAADTSGRGQLMLQLKLIKAYHLVGLLPLCLPYIEKIWAVREEINLMSWEPHLCNQLDMLVEKTMTEMYPSKDLIPEKYQQWLSINNK